jgi:16S rRNA (guanine527-N7)-methyltransferase
MDFIKELEKLNITVNDKIASRFDTYYHKLVEVNEYMNLTAITEEAEVYNKHFLDSLCILLANKFDGKKTLCDVGSGAGFPSIPLAIVNDNVEVTIIDALNKRIKFLNDLIENLGLSNASAFHERAEDFAKRKREAFDIVTARAVARLNVLAELCLPLTKLNGYFIAMKGKASGEELEEAKNAISILGGIVEEVISFKLPDDAGERELIVVKKVKSTPAKYPRQFAKIKERPL